MRRNIFYRGIRKDNQQYIIGYLYLSSSKYYIAGFTADHTHPENRNWIEVDGRTIGEFTGLMDNDDNYIFEDDIFEIDGIEYYVEYFEDTCRYVLTTGLGYDSRNCIDLTCDSIFGLSVKGKINQLNT